LFKTILEYKTTKTHYLILKELLYYYIRHIYRKNFNYFIESEKYFCYTYLKIKVSIHPTTKVRRLS